MFEPQFGTLGSKPFMVARQMAETVTFDELFVFWPAHIGEDLNTISRSLSLHSARATVEQVLENGLVDEFGKLF